MTLKNTPAAPMSISGAVAKLLPSAWPSWIISAQNTAMARFMPGPAAATHSMSCLGRRRLAKLTGTGLAQPKRIAPPPSSLLVSRIASGTSMVPTGSMCLIGFAVMRPRAAAVVSPK